jgi:hypothetical protein
MEDIVNKILDQLDEILKQIENINNILKENQIETKKEIDNIITNKD